MINDLEDFIPCSTSFTHTDGEAGQTGSGIVIEENSATLPVLQIFLTDFTLLTSNADLKVVQSSSSSVVEENAAKLSVLPDLYLSKSAFGNLYVNRTTFGDPFNTLIVVGVLSQIQ